MSLNGSKYKEVLSAVITKNGVEDVHKKLSEIICGRNNFVKLCKEKTLTPVHEKYLKSFIDLTQEGNFYKFETLYCIN